MIKGGGVGKKGKRASDTDDGGRGILYVVATPIGHLEDITLRALGILKSVDLIAAESAGHSRALCRHYGINTRLTRYNQHNRKTKAPELIRRLEAGQDIALVTNAGTPAISDPGVFLVDEALKAGVKTSPVPGPSALTAALSASGFRAARFLFVGFLSNRPGKRKKDLKDLRAEANTMVFFEAPHRLEAMLKDLLEALGDRQMVLLRELTKVYEESLRGPVSVVLENLEGREIKGECTLVVAGQEKPRGRPAPDQQIQRKIRKLLEGNRLSVKDMAEKLSLEKGISYREAYKACLAVKREMEKG